MCARGRREKIAFNNKWFIVEKYQASSEISSKFTRRSNEFQYFLRFAPLRCVRMCVFLQKTTNKHRWALNEFEEGCFIVCLFFVKIYVKCENVCGQTIESSTYEKCSPHYDLFEFLSSRIGFFLALLLLFMHCEICDNYNCLLWLWHCYRIFVWNVLNEKITK